MNDDASGNVILWHSHKSVHGLGSGNKNKQPYCSWSHNHLSLLKLWMHKHLQTDVIRWIAILALHTTTDRQQTDTLSRVIFELVEAGTSVLVHWTELSVFKLWRLGACWTVKEQHLHTNLTLLPASSGQQPGMLIQTLPFFWAKTWNAHSVIAILIPRRWSTCLYR